MIPKNYSNYELAQELLRLRTHSPELMAEAAARLTALASRDEPPAVDAGEKETWLIEDQDHFPRHRWLRIVDTGKTAHLQWENDANTATHFGRRDDAVAFQKLHVDFCALSIVTGHTFLNTPPAIASRPEPPAVDAGEKETFEQWWSQQQAVAKERLPGDDFLMLDEDNKSQYEAAFNAGQRLASREEAPAESAPAAEAFSPAFGNDLLHSSRLHELWAKCAPTPKGDAAGELKWQLGFFTAKVQEEVQAALAADPATVAQPVALFDDLKLSNTTAPHTAVSAPVAWLHYAAKKPSLRRVDFHSAPGVVEQANGWKTIPLGPIAAAAQRCPSQGCALSDVQCREIYWSLDKFGREIDNYDFGLPMLSFEDREEQVFKIIRAIAALKGTTPGGEDIEK